MRYGFVLPDMDIATAPELAAEAEAAGWDAVFLPDCISIETPGFPAGPACDPWIALAAMALRTSRVLLGPMVAALPRRRPWKLAREVATLDHLSGGRMLLPVGVGAAGDDAGFREVGEELGLRQRAERMGEALEILDGLWRGEPFSYAGKHFQIGRMTLLPPPVQRPRVPLWVVGVWPAQKSIGRALRWDGIIPQKKGGQLTPDDVRALRAQADSARAGTPFDIIVEGSTPGEKSAEAATQVQPWAEAGATWWMESMWFEHTTDSVLARIRQGPPVLR
jgi:alkanesulfonate monooxygenase SsuD/methylene tetrahydromethanopterin reductase-like flavin-dependent oxidoreductase (luciferase family)